MSRTENSEPELEVGEPAPEFELENPEGEKVALSDLDNYDGVLVVFMCNHCPFVQGQTEELKRLEEEFSSIAVVGINPNAETHPMDSVENMPEFLKKFGLDETNFYYLADPDQEVAESYGARCTPDPFLLDMRHRLFYHGKLTDREGPQGEINERYMEDAIQKMLKKQNPRADYPEPVGCSIKWKEETQEE
jgi:peroxiredoxin